MSRRRPAVVPGLRHDPERDRLVVEAAFVLSLAVRGAWPVAAARVRRGLVGLLSPAELRMVDRAEPGDLNPASGGWGELARDLGVDQPDPVARRAVLDAVRAAG